MTGIAANVAALIEFERAKYDRVWAMPEYRVACHGQMLWVNHRDLFPARVRTAIDFGCGTGRLVAQWRSEGIAAIGYDLSTRSVDPSLLEAHGEWFILGVPLWDLHDPPGVGVVDLGVCTDVMEHIPEEMVALTLDSICARANEVLFKIAHGPANDLGGEPLHVTQKPLSWWMAKIAAAVDGTLEFLGVHMRSGNEDSLIRWTARR